MHALFSQVGRNLTLQGTNPDSTTSIKHRSHTKVSESSSECHSLKNAAARICSINAAARSWANFRQRSQSSNSKYYRQYGSPKAQWTIYWTQVTQVTQLAQPAQLVQLRAANAASAARALIRSTVGSMGPQKPNEQYIERRWRSWCSCAQPTQPAQPEL